MGRFTRALRWARGAWPLVAIVILTLAGAALAPVFKSLPRDLGVQKKPLIKQLIYPTIGNPAIVKKGTTFTIEFDPRDRQSGAAFVQMREFRVSVTTSCDQYAVTMELPVQSVAVGASSKWPEYAASPGKDNSLYLVTVGIPRALPEDLYNMTVTGVAKNGEGIVDTQPHALQAVEEYKDRFSFCQLTDIHVYGPELNNSFASYYMRSTRPDGKDPSRKGAVYYQNAIQQINLMKPDFCVFTGDFMYGQSYFVQDQGAPWGITTEYEFEQLWFYEETLKLDVPVFMTIGNHDSFSEGSEAAKEDWFENWRRIYGPLYHSFDYGDNHFLALNSQDWPAEDRVLFDYGVSIQSEKYKGEFRGGGDRWAPGVSSERIAAIDESAFTGQLKWMRDDLASHQASRIRVVATHQEPWRKEGSGLMWASGSVAGLGAIGSLKAAFGFAAKYGNGSGRLAAVKLMSEYRVALEISGHLHSDFVEAFHWLDGTGQCVSANTTCTMINTDGVSRPYPGYRRIWINKGRVESVNYAEPSWSYPFYFGTNVGGVTDLTTLSRLAIESSFAVEPGRATDATFTISNHLAKGLPSAFARFPMPRLSGGYYYVVVNGRIARSTDFDQDGDLVPEQRVYQVYADLNPGEIRSVRLARSPAPDLVAPSGQVSINGGVRTVSGQGVTLSIPAADQGGSGVKDMILSNTPGFEGAQWEPYKPSLAWALEPGQAGPRVVYVKFRDYAMPANVSAVSQAGVIYNGP
jgi:3',5'-cyclic AMP phosphodiesterase CpdA